MRRDRLGANPGIVPGHRFADGEEQRTAGQADIRRHGGKNSNRRIPCMTVAGAKFEQWNQKGFMIYRAEPPSDRSKKEIETILTEDVAYGHEVGLPWETENIVRRARAVPPPEGTW